MQPHALELLELGAIRFGTFTLKSGITSPIYLDLRLIISRPQLLVALAEALYTEIQGCSFDLLCGVPYTALPLATAISIRHSLPMLLKRKERKAYGTGQLIEGIFTKGQTCLLIEDVITSGKSLLETIEPLEEEGLIVKDIVVLIDREQGGRELLEEKGYRIHSLSTLRSLIAILVKEGKVKAEVLERIYAFTC